MDYYLEHEIKVDENTCWFCKGEKRVEWWGIDGEDENGEPIIVEGVYDPCPECEEDEM